MGILRPGRGTGSFLCALVFGSHASTAQHHADVFFYMHGPDIWVVFTLMEPDMSSADAQATAESGVGYRILGYEAGFAT